MAHTPGPWEANYSECDIYANGKLVASAAPFEACEYEANVNLIAAAPDMLAALKLADHALNYAQAQVDSENDRHNLCKWWDQIKKVIDKAEGRTQ